MSQQEKQVKSNSYNFGDFRLDGTTGELWHGSDAVSVQRRVLDLLIFLVENRDQTVTKEEIQDAVWPGTIVSETALTRAVMKARRAINDDANEQKFIKTVHGRGYRFVAEVESGDATEAEGASKTTDPERRRALFRTATTYGAVAWLLNQAAAMVWEVFEWDKWPVQILLAVSVIGFFIALGVAWFYQPTREGLKLRSEVPTAPQKGRHRDRIVIALLLAALALSIAWNFRSAPDTVLEQQRVAILPVHNATGARDIDWVSLGLTALLGNRLLDADVLLVGLEAVRKRTPESTPLGQSIVDVSDKLAAGEGARFVLQAELTSDVTGYVLNSVLRDIRSASNTQLPAFSADSPTQAAQKLGDHLVQYFRPEGVELDAALASGDPFIDQAYARGMHEVLTGNLAAGKELLEVAALGAPDAFWPSYELAGAIHRLGDLDDSLSRFLPMLDRARDAGQAQHIAMLSNGIGIVYDLKGDFDAAERHYQEGIAAAQSEQLYKRLGVLYINYAILERARAQPGRAQELLSLAVAAYQQAGITDVPGELYIAKGNAAADGGDIDSAADNYRLALEAYRKQEFPRGEGLALSNLAWASQKSGDYDAAERFIEQGIAVRERSGDHVGVLKSKVRQADLTYQRGRLLEAHALATQIVDADYAAEESQILATARSIQAYAELGHGNYEDAARHFDQALRLDQEGGMVFGQLRALAGLAETALASGDLPEADRRAEMVLTHPGAEELPGFRFAAQSVRGSVMAQRGQTNDAIALWQQIIDEARRLGDTASQAKAALLLANHYLDRSQTEPASQWVALNQQLQPLDGHGLLAAAKLAALQGDHQRSTLLANQALEARGDLVRSDVMELLTHLQSRGTVE